MSKVTQLYDGLANALSGMGGARDKAAQSNYRSEVLTPDELLAAYRYAWLPRKIVDLPAQDSVRAWRTWNVNDKAKRRIKRVEDQFNLREKLLEAKKMARLYGASAIYIGTNSNNVKSPLGESESLRHLTVVDHMNLSEGELQDDPIAENYGKPKFYWIGEVRVHPSRLVVITGAEVPGFIFGDSVLNAPYQAIRDADGTASNVATMTYEAKIDVFKIPELMMRMDDPAYEQKLMKRLNVASMGKSTNNALVMDSEEEYEQKELQFGSLDQLVMTMYQVAAGAAGIPVTRLLGMSPGGLNSTGDQEVRDYYDTIRAKQEMELTPALEPLDTMILRKANIKNADYTWNSLWQMTEKERAEIGKDNSRTVKTLAEAGVFNVSDLTQPSVDLMSSVMPTLSESVDSDANSQQQ